MKRWFIVIPMVAGPIAGFATGFTVAHVAGDTPSPCNAAVARADAQDITVKTHHAYEYDVLFKWNDHTVRCQEFLTLIPPVLFDPKR